MSPQTSLLTLVPPSLELLVNVEESQLGQVAEGQKVQLEVPAYPNQMFTGTVKIDRAHARHQEPHGGRARRAE